jgi:hypothetical protein
MEIQSAKVLMDQRMALLSLFGFRQQTRKQALAQQGWRTFVRLLATEAAAVARSGEMRIFYVKIDALKPAKKRALPMLKRLDGSMAQTPEAIAARWVEHYADELAGVDTSFAERDKRVAVAPCTHHHLTRCLTPSWKLPKVKLWAQLQSQWSCCRLVEFMLHVYCMP